MYEGRIVALDEFDRAIYDVSAPVIDLNDCEIIHPAISRIRAKKADERAQISDNVCILRDMWEVANGGAPKHDVFASCCACTSESSVNLSPCILCRLNWHESCALAAAGPSSPLTAAAASIVFPPASISPPTGFDAFMCAPCSAVFERNVALVF